MIKTKKIFELLEIIFICIIIFSGSSALASYRYISMGIVSILALGENVFCNNGKIKIEKNNKIILLCLIIIVYLIFQGILGYNIASSFKYILFFSCGFIFAVLKISDEKFIKKMLNSFLIISIIIAISILASAIDNNFVQKYTPFLLPKSEASLQMFKQEIKKGTFSGFACERSYAAFSMIIGIIITISNLVIEKKYNKSEIFKLIILFCALFCTGKRMLLLIAIFLFIFVFLINAKKYNITKFLKISIVLVILSIIACMMFPQITRVFDRLIIGNQQKDTIEARINNYWIYCIEMFRNKPILGYGINVFVDYIELKNVDEIYNAHNIYLQLLGETGIIGFTMFSMLFTFSAVKTYKAIKCSWQDENKNKNFILNVSLLFQLTFLVYGLSGNTLYYNSQLFLYFISINITNNMLLREAKK